MDMTMTRPEILEFIRAELGRMTAFVRRRMEGAGAVEAEDIVQDVALNIFERGDITAPIRNLSAYIYRALKNRIVDYLRKKKSSISLDEHRSGEQSLTLADVLSDNTIAPQSDLERRDLHDLLYRAIDALKPEDRAIILATDFVGWTFRDLAEEWDVPLGTLLARKARALKKIRTYLEASGKSL